MILKSIKMTKNIVIKIISNRNLQSAIDLIRSSEHTDRDKLSWDFNKMTALIAFKDSELIGVIPFEQHTIKVEQETHAEILWITAAFIKPGYRSLGIGSAMDNEIKNLFSKKKYVFVMRHNEGTLAYRWYVKNGYKVLSEVHSLKLDKNKFNKLSYHNYEVINEYDQIRSISSKLLSSFNSYNSDKFNFPKRSLTSWTDRLKYHYYSKYYDYNIILDTSNNDLVNFALLGLTSFKDDIFRIDILEISCLNNFSDFQNLISNVIDYANQRNVNEIRVQVAVKDYLHEYFCKLGFSHRWKTNLMIKPLSNKIELNFVNTRFFQIDYI